MHAYMYPRVSRPSLVYMEWTTNNEADTLVITPLLPRPTPDRWLQTLPGHIYMYPRVAGPLLSHIGSGMQSVESKMLSSSTLFLDLRGSPLPRNFSQTS